jgi:hypothetical protein
MNAARPSSVRDVPSRTRSASTCFCVAMPAWSVPSTHFAGRPSIRARRTSTSWIEPFSAWPMCSAPVTLGGGTAIENVSSGVPSGAGWNRPDASHRSTMRGSASAGS